jgi:hypothetical protein
MIRLISLSAKSMFATGNIIDQTHQIRMENSPSLAALPSSAIFRIRKSLQKLTKKCSTCKKKCSKPKQLLQWALALDVKVFEGN